MTIISFTSVPQRKDPDFLDHAVRVIKVHCFYYVWYLSLHSILFKVGRNSWVPLNAGCIRLEGLCWWFSSDLGIRCKEGAWNIQFAPFLTVHIYDTSQWFCLSMPSRKEAWQPSKLAWCRKWDREENKKICRKDQHQLCSVSTELKKGEVEDVWTTRWRTRNCLSHLLHERSLDVWRHEITYSTMKRNHGTENCSGYKKENSSYCTVSEKSAIRQGQLPCSQWRTDY